MVDIDKDSILLCPSCGEHNLHQEKVFIYTKFTDDYDEMSGYTIEANQETGTNTTIIGTKENPSSRRCGVRITFWCEHCDVKPELTIAQQKGSEYIEWDNKNG